MYKSVIQSGSGHTNCWNISSICFLLFATEERILEDYGKESEGIMLENGKFKNKSGAVCIIRIEWLKYDVISLWMQDVEYS